MNISIIGGLGVVGQSMCREIPEAVVHDPQKDIDNTDYVNTCDIAFVCVPTPMNAKNGKCDTSIVKQVLQTYTPDMFVVRSTVPPGFCGMMYREYKRPIVFQPEYLGETPLHPYRNGCDWLTLGGLPEDTRRLANFWAQRYHSSLRIHCVDWETAELAKYMENAFFAVKLLFCAEFARLAEALEVDYQQLRETWLMDHRINPDHTQFYPDQPGFSGKCLPKDTSAILYVAQQLGLPMPVLQAAFNENYELRTEQGLEVGGVSTQGEQA